MGFKNFRLNIVSRVVLLLALLFFSVWGFISAHWVVTPVVCGILSIALIIELIYYLEQTNRKLKTFLDFIGQHDFTNSSPDSKIGNSFSELAEAYKVITDEFRRLNAERDANSRYLELVVEHISVALVCLNENDELILMNKQAKKIFQCPYMHSVTAMKKIDPDLPTLINSIENGEHRLVSINLKDESMKLAVYATGFQLLDNHYKLISFQNIRDDLEQQEIDSWQKLIRVLTHEIMNSVTPIISLTEVIKEKIIPEHVNGPSISEMTTEDLSDLKKSIYSIESRSKGLHQFVQTYRRLTNIPSPKKVPVLVSTLIENVLTLFSPELEKRGITLVAHYDNHTNTARITVDQQQIEQVLINLMKNAMESLMEYRMRYTNKKIQLNTHIDDSNNVVIHVIDNGPGISQEYMEQIFVPFFSTKKNGTGIGLSISRQIILQNKGLLSIASTLGDTCVFSLRFRQS